MLTTVFSIFAGKYGDVSEAGVKNLEWSYSLVTARKVELLQEELKKLRKNHHFANPTCHKNDSSDPWNSSRVHNKV